MICTPQTSLLIFPPEVIKMANVQQQQQNPLLDLNEWHEFLFAPVAASANGHVPHAENEHAEAAEDLRIPRYIKHTRAKIRGLSYAALISMLTAVIVIPLAIFSKDAYEISKAAGLEASRALYIALYTVGTMLCFAFLILFSIAVALATIGIRNVKRMEAEQKPPSTEEPTALELLEIAEVVL